MATNTWTTDRYSAPAPRISVLLCQVPELIAICSDATWAAASLICPRRLMSCRPALGLREPLDAFAGQFTWAASGNQTGFSSTAHGRWQIWTTGGISSAGPFTFINDHLIAVLVVVGRRHRPPVHQATPHSDTDTNAVSEARRRRRAYHRRVRAGRHRQVRGQRAPRIPVTDVRYGFAQTATHFYVFGGVSNGTRINNVNRMDIATGVWQPRAAMPFTSEAPTCALMTATGIVYCAEGDTGAGFASYNIATDTWTPLAAVPVGEPLRLGLWCIQWQGVCSGRHLVLPSVQSRSTMWRPVRGRPVQQHRRLSSWPATNR